MSVAYAIIVFLIVLAFVQWPKHQVPKLKGLYAQHLPGDVFYLLKVIVLTLILTIAKLRNVYKRRKNPKAELEQLHLQSGSPEPGHVASLTFKGVDKQGNAFSARLLRKPDLKAEVHVTLRLADGKLFSHPSNGSVVVDETPQGEEADEGYASAGGLRIRALDLVRTYRILYSGTLRREDGRLQEVNLRLWFRSLVDPASFEIDALNPFQRAKELANEHWPLLELVRLVKPDHGRCFEQSGEMTGHLELLGNDVQKVQLDLNGIRQYAHGPCRSATPDQGFLRMMARFEKGLIFSVEASSFKHSGLSHQISGLAHTQPGFVYPLSWTDLHLANLPNTPPETFDMNLKTHGLFYSFHLKNVETVQRSSDSMLVHETIYKASLNGEEVGYALVEFNFEGERAPVATVDHQALKVHVAELSLPNLPLKAPLAVNLSDPFCRLSGLTGGKAAKLADIVAVQKTKVKGSELIRVPEGFAVTVAAYENHLSKHPQLKAEVRSVLELASKLNRIKDPAKLDEANAKFQEACEHLHESFLATALTDELLLELETNMAATFGPSWNQHYTAVRSSAVGEDGTEASGAGQMETFLGRKGLDRIGEAIKLCWASHYAFRALQYRRQLAAKLDSPMAVLVQGLVQADVAGVLFTRHPDNGSLARSVINAAYGIGEGVVSGQVQPDTITIEHLDSRSSDITIHHDFLGAKAGAFKLNEKTGQVELVPGSNQETTCCLTDEELRKLYETGRFVERIFGSARDVEFALTKHNGQIHILQARPITTADMEQDWELLHEFDGPIASDNEWITTANVQEMMPGPLAPLSLNAWLDSLGIDESQTAIFLKPRRRFRTNRVCCAQSQHIFMNWTMMGAALIDEFRKRSGDMAIFGRNMEQIHWPDFQKQNHMESKLWQHGLNIYEWYGRLFPKDGMKKLEPIIENYSLNFSNDPAELHRFIRQDLGPFVRETWMRHIDVTVQATMMPMILMMTLDPTLNWGPQIYEDMATLLANCTDVYSADVPKQLEAIAQAVKQDAEALAFFVEHERCEVAKWLLSDGAKVPGQLFRKFLQKHGHRCVRDSDIREKSWAQEPEKVVDALKVMVTSKTAPTSAASHKHDLSEAEALAAIKTPVTTVGRYVIKYFLPKARVAVGKREWAKSLGIKITDVLRRAYYHLAELLTTNGWLPDEDLMFFLTPDEIGQLLLKRSPKLIAKALRRRKIFAKFNGQQWPELVQGRPEPLNGNLHLEKKEGSFAIKGMAVGSGSIEGTARVVTSLAEANQIQNGDILIVPYTDVGWTPYFPLMGGLVTELGGLISHGAVVAREYGLPCLVGCKMATQLIKTGDRVQLDGHLGEIRVLA